MRRNLAAFVAAITLTFSTVCAAALERVDPETAGLNPEQLERLDNLLRSRIDAGQFPGAVTLIMRNGRIGHLSVLGRRAPDGEPMSEDTLFRIYSMTKPIVSVATMMLLEEGKILLSHPVSAYLPEFEKMTVATGVDADGKIQTEPARRPITIQDLLRHTAGLTYGFFGKGPARTALNEVNGAFGDMTNREVSRALGKLPLEHQPGTTWEYSRATDVLGALIEVIEGKPLGEVLKAKIFDPLGMKDTGFWVENPGDHARIAEAVPEDRKIGQFDMFDPREKRAFESGGGGLMSTVIDYARFAQMLMNGGQLEGVRILSPRSVALMTADHMGDRIKRGKYYFVGQGFGFGLGFGVRVHEGIDPGLGHKGLYYWGGAAGTLYAADPADQTLVLFMMQAPKQRQGLRPVVQNMALSAVVGNGGQ
jgi:CubicO group peptidase (beta-lactamase class C family)